jgi:hypothetical protein
VYPVEDQCTALGRLCNNFELFLHKEIPSQTLKSRSVSPAFSMAEDILVGTYGTYFITPFFSFSGVISKYK